MNRRRALLLTLLASASGTAVAAPAVTLEQAYRAALSSSDTVRIERARLEQAEERKIQARGSILPRVTAVAEASTQDLPGTTTTLKLWQHRPPMPWTPETRAMAGLVGEIGNAMGTKIDTIATMGASDANIIAAQGVPTLCGLGPVGGAIMTRDEYIELPTLVERATLVAALAHRLAWGRG